MRVFSCRATCFGARRNRCSSCQMHAPWHEFFRDCCRKNGQHTCFSFRYPFYAISSLDTEPSLRHRTQNMQLRRDIWGCLDLFMLFMLSGLCCLLAERRQQGARLRPQHSAGLSCW